MTSCTRNERETTLASLVRNHFPRAGAPSWCLLQLHRPVKAKHRRVSHGPVRSLFSRELRRRPDTSGNNRRGWQSRMGEAPRACSRRVFSTPDDLTNQVPDDIATKEAE